MTTQQPPFPPQPPFHPGQPQQFPPPPPDWQAWQQFQAWQNSQAQVQADATAKSAGNLAVAGAICGVIGLFLLGVLLGPIALVLGAIAASRLQPGQPGRGAAITAIVLGVIDFFAFFIVVNMLG